MAISPGAHVSVDGPGGEDGGGRGAARIPGSEGQSRTGVGGAQDAWVLMRRHFYGRSVLRIVTGTRSRILEGRYRRYANDVKDAMGQSSLRMAEIYTSVRPDAARSANQLLDFLEVAPTGIDPVTFRFSVGVEA